MGADRQVEREATNVGGEHRNGRRSDARNAQRVPERVRPHLREPLDDLRGQPGTRSKGNPPESAAARPCARARSRCPAASDSPRTSPSSRRWRCPTRPVSRIDLQRNAPARATRSSSRTSGWRSSWLAATRVSRLPFGPASSRATRDFARTGLVARSKSLPSLIVHQTDLATTRRQPEIRVVDAQQQPMLGARREHPVRLETAFRDQVVDQNADVRLVPPQLEAGSPLQPRRAALMPATRPCAAASS